MPLFPQVLDYGNSTGQPKNCGLPNPAGRYWVLRRILRHAGDFLAAVHPDDRHISADTLRKSKGERSAATDIRIVHPNGELRWVRIRARAYIDGQGAPNQLSGMFVDVTEQKTAESEAELQRQEVAHLTRVTVLGELSGAIAHEVNQPLTAILSNAQAALYLLASETPNYSGNSRRVGGHRAGG